MFQASTESCLEVTRRLLQKSKGQSQSCQVCQLPYNSIMKETAYTYGSSGSFCTAASHLVSIVSLLIAIHDISSGFVYKAHI
jgi:hypothetical protein